MTVFSWLSDNQRTVLESSGIQIRWELRLKSYLGDDLGDFTDCLVLSDSYIARDATEQVQGTGHLVLCRPLNWQDSLACPRIYMKDIDTDTEIYWDMGTWVFREPGRSLENEDLWEVDIADIIDIMGVETGATWTIADGTNIGDAVAQVIQEPFYATPHDLPAIPWEMANDAQWPITERSTWIDIANELLEAGAFASLYANRNGVLTTYPWEVISQVTPIWKFQEDLKICWLREDCFREPPPASVPNKWIGINRSVDNPVEGNGVFTIDNSVGRRLVPHVFEVSAVDQASLVSMVTRARQDDVLQGNRLNLKNAITPVFWHGDVVEVCLPKLEAGGVNNPVLGMVIGWRIDMDDSDMNTIVEVIP